MCDLRWNRVAVVAVCGLSCGRAWATDPCLSWSQGAGQPIFGATAATYDAGRQRVVAIFSSVPAQHWEFDGQAWTQQSPAALPVIANNQRAAMVFDESSSRCVLVGAQNMWTYDGAGWSMGAALPQPLFNAAAVFDAVRLRTVVFGGRTSGNVFLNTTLEHDGVSVVTLAPSGSPSPRIGHAMAFDARRGVTVLFGGTDASATVLGDLWEWDGENWLQIAPTGSWPAARWSHAMAFDPNRGVVVMHGGSLSSSPSSSREWWEWDGASWLRRSAEESGGPTSSAHHLMHFGATGEMVAALGSASPWTYFVGTPQAPWIAAHPESRSAAAGESVVLSMTMGDAGPYAYQWRKDGAIVPGATGPSLAVPSAMSSDAGVYTCDVWRTTFGADCATATAGPAALTVGAACPSDVDGNGVINFADLNAVISLFNTECP